MMRLQQNRYLWVHFAGLAFVPLLLDICLAGLASAGPALAFQGQFWAIALLAIPPGLAMQCFKPFYIFSLPPSALKPSVLSEDQRRCLQIFKSWQIKGLAIAVAVFSLWLLAQLYAMSPEVSSLLTPRAGLVSAAIAFFIASTFMQISVSAARALLISPEALRRVPAVEGSAIASDFLIAGIKVNKLLPDLSVRAESKTEASTPIVHRPTTAEKDLNSTQAVKPLTQQEPGEDPLPPAAEPLDSPEATPENNNELEEIVIPETLPPKEADES